MGNSITTIVNDDLFSRFSVLQAYSRKDGKILSNSAFLAHLLEIGIGCYELGVIKDNLDLKRQYLNDIQVFKERLELL